MTSHQQAELEFWRNTIRSYSSPEAYRAARRRNLKEGYAPYFTEIYQETGVGLDLASGPVSVLEELAGQFFLNSIDELMDEYRKLIELSDIPDVMSYARGDGRALPFGRESLDFVWCVNMIDHTEDPQKVLSEIYRVLKPGGRLYFWVNFDRPPLAPAHHALWNIYLVEEMLLSFHLRRATIDWSDEWKKYRYWGLYVK